MTSARAWRRSSTSASPSGPGPDAGASFELRDPRVVGVVDAAENPRPGAAAGVAGGKPAPLRHADPGVERAAGALVERRHAPVLGREARIGADRPLDGAARET